LNFDPSALISVPPVAAAVTSQGATASIHIFPIVVAVAVAVAVAAAADGINLIAMEILTKDRLEGSKRIASIKDCRWPCDFVYWIISPQETATISLPSPPSPPPPPPSQIFSHHGKYETRRQLIGLEGN